ncbi:MAG: hypothetical protein QOH91_3419, partial [Mycobacterium sp.]|nr:hypothetical protein [Mycobacterium sp.]
MRSSGRRRDDADATGHDGPLESPELRRLAEARTALHRARRKAKWIRRCKDLQAAADSVHVASLAAHNAGIGWTQIGNVLGIQRATTPTSTTQIGPPPATPRTSPDGILVRTNGRYAGAARTFGTATALQI